MCVCVCVWLLSHSLHSLFQGTVTEPVEFYQKIEGNAGAWGKAVATIDASAARVFAYRWCLSSHEHKKNHVEGAGTDDIQKVVRMKDSHTMLYVNLVRFPSPISNRVFAAWFCWRKEPDNSFLVAFGPMEDCAREAEDAVELFMVKQEERREREGKAEDGKAFIRDTEVLKLMVQRKGVRKDSVEELDGLIKQDPIASKALRATMRGYWRIMPLAPSVCEVTYLVQGELGGSIPAALLNARIKSMLSSVRKMQVKFARNGKLVDKEMRDVFASPPPLAELSEEQMSVVEDCRSLESEDGSEWETLASPSPFVTMWMKHAPAKENERSIEIGKATAVIDCPVREAVGESRVRGERHNERCERASGAIAC